MGGYSLQADPSLLQPRRRRSFSFGRRSASEGPDLAKRSLANEATTPEVAVRAQKAAAWLWYERGVGEVVLPTKRPSPATVTPRDNKSHVIDDSGSWKAGDQHTVPNKHPEAQLAHVSPRGVSRFKAEVSSFAGKINGGPQPSPASAVTPSTPLYDEFDLSGLRIQMTDIVKRLQQEQPKGTGHPPAGKVSEDAKSRKSPAQCTTPEGRRRSVAATSVSSATDHLLTPSGPTAAAAKAGRGGSVGAASSVDHQPTKSSMPLSSLMPFSVLHRLFRRVVSGSFLNFRSKTSAGITRNPPIPGVMHHPEMLAFEGEDTQYQHHHHYIHHHHHHHYHYGKSPEESAGILHSRRRHSESSGICPRIPSVLEAESDEEEEEVKRNPSDAFPARCRRRHSDSFVLHPTSKEADFNWEVCVKEETEKAALMLSLKSPRRYTSERFSTNKIPSTVRQDLQGRGRDDFQERLLHIKSRRLSKDHQSCRPDAPAELAGVEKRLGREGGKTGRGTYKLGGGETPVVVHAPCRRRHSEEGFRMRPEEADRSEMVKNIPTRPHTSLYVV